MKIIYGVSGTGKSEYIFNKIKESGEEKTYIITPEQFSFTAEKRLLDTIKEGATLKCEVLSFERMAYRVIKETIPEEFISIGKSGKAEIIYDAIEKNKDSLNFLGKSQENVDMILTQITEFKKHNIKVDDLKKQIDLTDDKYLKAKLNDMLVSYKYLEEKIDNNFLDENDLLTILESNIEESHLFNNAVFYIDEFAGFTKQEYEVIRKIEKIAKEVYITVCTDDLRITKSPEMDIFYDNKQSVQTLSSIVDFDKDNQIKLDKKYRFKNEELAHLEENIYSVPYRVYEKDVKNIFINHLENKYEEIEYVASNIVKLVRDEGYRYKDIAVICRDIDNYSNLCKAIFAEYDVPVFIDMKKDITQNLLIKYVLSIFDIFTQNWSYEAVFNYIKTGFLKIDNVFELENYCLKWGIKGKKWYEKAWDFEKKEDANNFNLEQEKIIRPLMGLKESLKNNKSAKQISKGIYEFIDNNIDKDNMTEDMIEGFNIIIEALEEISKIFADEKVSFEHYSKLLKIGLSSKELNEIPQTQDKVTVGDVNRSRTHKVKVVFIIGVNDGAFPSVNTAEGFFNDKDRENLKKEGFELAKGTREKMYEENFNIYKAFSTAEEKLFISYPTSDFDGNTLRKSLLISRIKKIFPKLKEQEGLEDEVLTRKVTFSKLLNNLEDSSWSEVYKWYDKNDKEKLDQALQGLSYSNVPEKLSKDVVHKLFGKNLRVSISKLETYRACPFSYFLKYGLKLSEKEKLDIKPVDTGSFLHNTIDEFFKRVKNVKELSDEEIKHILEEIIDESMPAQGKFTLTAKYRTLLQRLKKVVFISMKYIIESLRNSDFDVLGTEISFGRDGKDPIEIKIDDDKKVFIEGKIDRVDIAKLPGGKFIRVIDYKSSIKDIDLNQVVAGLQLQLITYVSAVCKENEDVEPAGALYYTLLEPKILKNIKSLSKEEIEEQIKSNFRMTGLVLADVNVIKAMDKNLLEGKSNVIPVTLKKDGDINYSSSKTVTKEEFEKLQKYTNKLIKQISKEILDGKIDLKPYYMVSSNATPCTNCSFKSICQFNSKFKGNDYKFIESKKRKQVLDEITNMD